MSNPSLFNRCWKWLQHAGFMHNASALALVLLTGICNAAPAVNPEAIKTDGMRITLIKTGEAITVEPLVPQHAEMTGVLKVEQPNWRAGLRLGKVGWVYRALKPGSLRVTVAEKPEQVLAEKTDYVLDPDWATLGAVQESKVAPGTPLKFEYDFTLTRLDLVERLANGKIVLKKGVEDKNEPLLPEVTPGATPLFSVYLPPNTAALSRENILCIDPAAPATYVANAATLKPITAKLQKGEPVTIAFLGDSITEQKAEGLRDGQGSYIDRFAKYLEKKYPASKVVVTPKETVIAPAEKQVVIVKAGIGGNDSGQGLARMDKDVMAHKPDLVVVMFGVNDENKKEDGSNTVSPVQYRANFEKMIEKVKTAGGQMILMTTSWKNKGWATTKGNLNEYAAVIRDMAKTHKLCCVDHFAAWENLPKHGYPYMVYLGTCINHPIDLGHQLFFEGLKAAFEGGK